MSDPTASDPTWNRPRPGPAPAQCTFLELIACLDALGISDGDLSDALAELIGSGAVRVAGPPRRVH